MYVLAFDRDWTVDVNPHPHREAVPLEWVRYWAHETEHEVWAIGNQYLVGEADIPGTVESVRRRDGNIDALGEQDEDGYFEWWPDREERLDILAELFPNADGHVVVDDLDLGYVEGWGHYHAWDFVEAVQDDSLDIVPPSSTNLSPDGGFESEDAVHEVLDTGYVFELTHRTEGEPKTHLVTHVEPERPSMKPLHGPPTFWFDTVGNDNRLSVRLPEIDALQPVPCDQLANPFAEAAFAAVREQIKDEGSTVELATIRTLLTDATADSTTIETHEALRLALITLQHRDDARALAVETVFQLLDDCGDELETETLKTLWKHTNDDPAVLRPHVSELATHPSPESPSQQPATRCLMVVAEAYPESVLDAVPAVESAAKANDTATQSFAVYTLSCVAEEFPEAVVPTLSVLIEAMQEADDTIQTNALAALGKIASNYPDAAEPIVDELVTLFDADPKRVRNNAVGLLGYLAQEHPALVIEYADQIAALLGDDNIQARVNASIALQRAGEADPAAIRAQQTQLESALDDPSPEVRANVCTLIGNANVSVSIDELRDMEQNDLDETVRERASWAINQLE